MGQPELRAPQEGSDRTWFGICQLPLPLHLRGQPTHSATAGPGSSSLLSGLPSRLGTRGQKRCAGPGPAKRASEERARSPPPLPSPGFYRVASTCPRHKESTSSKGLRLRVVSTPAPRTGLSLQPLPTHLLQLTRGRGRALASLRPGPTCARVHVLCPGSARSARPEVRRQCSRRRRRRREVRLSPVGRAAPRSAAAIAGQAAGGGAREAAGSEG